MDQTVAHAEQTNQHVKMDSVFRVTTSVMENRTVLMDLTKGLVAVRIILIFNIVLGV